MFQEYSKQLTFWILLSCGIFMVAILIGWAFGLPNAFQMLAVIGIIAGSAAAYYFTKARDENLLKIKQNGAFSKDEMMLMMQLKQKESGNWTESLSKIISSGGTEIGG